METRTSSSINELHTRAYELGMKNFQRMPKTELHEQLKNLNEHYNQEILDPIMLTPLGKHVYTFKRPNGGEIQYNVESLVQYFVTTGMFEEPASRIPIPESELQVIDEVVKRSGKDLPSVVQAKKNVKVYAAQKVKLEGIEGLKFFAGDFITKILNMMEDEEVEREDIEMALLLEIFPSLAEIYRHLNQLDKEYSVQIFQMFYDVLQGPPNKPTMDEHCILPIVHDFFKDTIAGTKSEADYGF